MKLQAKLIICALLLIMGGIVGWNMKKPEYVTTIKTKIDTLYIESKPLTLWKTAYINVVQNDTTIITSIDTIFIEKDLKIASDTVEFKEGWLGVEYYYIPINKFRYDWRPIDIPIIYTTTTITVVKKPKWYLKKEVWLLGGIVSGILLTK